MKFSCRLLEDLDADDDVEDDQTGSSRATAHLPKEPPFYVFVSPLQPGLGEKELREFFIEQNDDVVKCEFKGQVSRVELKTRDSLARALFYSGRVLCGREVCVDLSPPAPPAPPQATVPPTSSPKEQHARGSLRPSTRDRQPTHRDAPDGNSERGYRSGGYRRGGPSDQQYEKGPDQRYRGPRHGESERVGDRQQHNGGQPGSQGPDGAVPKGETDGAVAGGTAGENGETPTPGYRRLQLKPRTKSVAAGESQPASRNASIFGSGNPHDEIAYERKKKETTGTGEGTATDTSETAGTGGDASSRNNDAKPSSTDRGSTISSKPSPWKTVSPGQHHKDGPHHKHREGETGTHHNGQTGRPYQHHKPGASWEKVKERDASNAPQPVKKNERKTPKKVLQLDEEGFQEVVVEKHPHGSATKEEPEGEPSKAPLTDNTVSNAFAALDLESDGED